MVWVGDRSLYPVNVANVVVAVFSILYGLHEGRTAHFRAGAVITKTYIAASRGFSCN